MSQTGLTHTRTARTHAHTYRHVPADTRAYKAMHPTPHPPSALSWWFGVVANTVATGWFPSDHCEPIPDYKKRVE